jgi:cytochrome P450
LIPVEIDPPDHIHYRRIVDPLFGPRRINQLEASLRSQAVELVDNMLEKQEFDFLEEFAVPYPTSAFLRLMGLPADDEHRSQFVQWMDRVIHAKGAPPADMAAQDAIRAEAGAEIYGLFAKMLDERSAKRGEDIVSILLDARFAGDRELTPLEILNFCFLLFIAGLDTVTSALGFGFMRLAGRPDLQDRLVSDRSLIPNAVEELLRYDSAVHPSRTVMRPCTIRGVEFQPGDRVTFPIASADRDEEVFEQADELVLDRHPNHHLAFGAGNHRCLGSHLARLELRIAYEEIFRRIPRFSVPDGANIHFHGGGVKGLDNLPLRIG